ncbi:MAG: hypothetical protein K0U66_07310, partial [Gammaproteobacteria bacterium]|nr:hypothetical protein [Gammaproteobacteria bacterium]
MKKIILISVMLFCSYAYAQQTISDTTLTAFEGEKVEFELTSGVQSKGLLKKVGETTVVMLYDNG